MIGRGWGGAVATAVVAAAAAAAAQLGLAYGMGVVQWTGVPAGGSGLAWTSSLAWATWIAATSTVVGAVIADRSVHRPAGPTRPAGLTGMAGMAGMPGSPDPGGAPAGQDAPGTGLPVDQRDQGRRRRWRLMLVLAAALGAGTAVGLVAVPARLATAADHTSPQLVAAGYAAAGVIIGLMVAIGALTARAVAANLLATGTWLWLLAVAVVSSGMIADRDWPRVPLGFWEPALTGSWFRGLALPDAAIALGGALVIGALAALPAARRGEPRLGVIASGGAGPLLVAAAYLLSQPDLVIANAVDLSRHLAAPYAVIAGLAGSMLVAARWAGPRPGPGLGDQPPPGEFGIPGPSAPDPGAPNPDAPGPDALGLDALGPDAPIPGGSSPETPIPGPRPATGASVEQQTPA